MNGGRGRPPGSSWRWNASSHLSGPVHTVPKQQEPCIYGARCNKFATGECRFLHSGVHTVPEQQKPSLYDTRCNKLATGEYRFLHTVPKQQKPCRNGTRCNKIATGECRFLHTFPRQQKPCHYDTRCIKLATGECRLSHSDISPRFMHMNQGLSKRLDLNAFGEVSTTSSSYGIENVRTLASFNFLRDGRIAVPGLLPRLRPPTSDISYPIIKDDHVLPSTPAPTFPPPFDPLIRAFALRSPSIPASSLSCITTAGCLRRLSQFFSRRPRPSTAERLDLEFRDGALFMSRWEADPLNQASPGYGMQFEDHARQFCAEGPLRESLSSRIVAYYELGGLRLGVQVEVDAYECECHEPGSTFPPASAFVGPKPPPPLKAKEAGTRQASQNRFDVLSLDNDDDSSGGDDHPSPRDDKGLAVESVVRAGARIPLACAVEIKTRRKAINSDPGYWLPQLYFQQTPRVFVATHKNGSFWLRDMTLKDESQRLRDWEAENQVGLARLVALLREVRAEAEMWAAAGGEGRCKLALVLRAGERRGGRDWEAALYERDGEGMVSGM